MSLSAPDFERGSSDLREAILRVATQLFAEKGYAATSMREVAEAAACTKPALYYYFDSKAALFIAVIRSATSTIDGLLESCFSGPGTVRERMQRAAESYFDHVRREPTTIKALWRSELLTESGQPAFDWRSTRQRYWELTLELLEEGVACGEIGAHVDLDHALHLLVGLVDVRSMLWVLQQEPIPENCAERALRLLFQGMSP